MRTHVISAIFRRDFAAYFSGPVGYLFIAVFIVATAVCNFALGQDAFFSANLANLAQLNGYMPWLLLFMVPAVTMGIWAEERNQGTDVLLLTLPASDFEVMLGKYLAALGIYSVALLFSLSNVIVLAILGRPDPGLLFGAYFGYWLMGAALLATSMIGSLLSRNATVAFILGALLCLPLVAASLVASFLPDRIVGETLPSLISSFGVTTHFERMADGKLTLSGLLYFSTLTVFMLYVNMVLIGHRHWSGGKQASTLGMHYVLRIASAVLILVGISSTVQSHDRHFDITAEQLHSLSPVTKEILSSLDSSRPVHVTAYVSPLEDVPTNYVQTRLDMVTTLRELEYMGGGSVRVTIKETRPYTDLAREARDVYNISPEKIGDEVGGHQSTREVFLGMAFSCGTQQQVIRFLHRGLPVEYEIARSLRVVASAKRKRIGVVNNELHIMGDFDTMMKRSYPRWEIALELGKQYELVEVEPKEAIPADLDALIVAQPSSLGVEGFAKIRRHILSGHPTLFIEDPLPRQFAGTSAGVTRINARGRGMGGGPGEAPDLGDVKAFLETFGIGFNDEMCVWDEYTPHPRFEHLESWRVVFIGQGGQGKQPFNPESPITSGLQEAVFLFPGYLEPKSNLPEGIKVIPLITTGKNAGTFQWISAINQMAAMFGGDPYKTPDRLFRKTLNPGNDILSAHVQGSMPWPTFNDPKPEKDPDAEGEDAAEKQPEAPTPDKATVNMIVLCDLDAIGKEFFDIRNDGDEEINFDNVTFILNCIDQLAGDTSFIDLRKRRPKHRTLETIEASKSIFAEAAKAVRDQAEDESKAKLDEAKQAMEDRIAEVQNDKSLDPRAQAQKVAQTRNLLQKRLTQQTETIEDEKNRRISEARTTLETSVDHLQGTVKVLAVLLPPIPPLFIGIFIFFVRRGRERASVSERRLL